MATAKAEKDEMVFPGSFLTTGEEYAPGENTYEDDSGDVHSLVVGKTEFDDDNREVRVVRRAKTAKPVDVGSTVFGVVTNVKSTNAMVEAISAKNGGEERSVINTFAMIPISAVSNMYIDNLSDVFSIGDLIQAKATTVTPYMMDLTTKDPHLGVVKGFCRRCRKPLKLFGSQLKCTSCGNTEKRKMSNHYLVK